jgi:hypothetical protein
MGPIEQVPETVRPGTRGPHPSPLAVRMMTMEVDDSFIADCIQEYHIAQHWQQRLKPKKFSVRKEAYLGWRVRRVE